ncbi:MAG: PAS domain-containing protein, partial [Chloroflexi bacterium]|nr:PAS domain-containing protein [Chloroflexota bacterium]
MSDTEAKPKTNETSNEFEALLEYLHSTRGFDFTAYKRSSLQRRMSKRINQVGVSTYDEYRDYLEVHPDEFPQLFNTILINVTDFFRDRDTWQYVRESILPRIIANRHSRGGIRMWCAGCASGEEAYTLAMLLCDALGLDEFYLRTKLYATDVDEHALNHARQATYEPKHVQNVPDDWKAKYFDANNGQFTIKKELRRAVIFGRHDLIQNAPISKVDLLICRNTLMYFHAEAQAKILQRFAFALNEGGHLLLGRAEMLVSRSKHFVPVDMKHRVFMRNANAKGRERLLASGVEAAPEPTGPYTRALFEVALEKDSEPQVILDANGLLVFVNARARALFGLAAADLNRPFRELELSYRPVELRTPVQQALTQGRAIAVRDVEWTDSDAGACTFDVSIVPLFDANARALGTKFTFSDVSRFKRLEEALQQSHLELETTNEELQSTVEELETTNEELQSTNEELETMNEELQSTNEELGATNDLLRQRGE